MSTRAPFFEPPLPQPDQLDEPRHFSNVPWSPPINVVPVVVPIEIDVVATDEVVIRLMDVQAFGRGVVLRVETWVNPDSADRVQDRHGMPMEPRIGLLLADGTKLGAGDLGYSPDVEPDEQGTASRPMFIMAGGGAGDLRVTNTWWLSPLPSSDAELVVKWEALDVAETFFPLALDRLREASGRARELWHVPDMETQEGGWFAYAPHGHTAYGSSFGVSTDDSGRIVG